MFGGTRCPKHNQIFSQPSLHESAQSPFNNIRQKCVNSMFVMNICYCHQKVFCCNAGLVALQGRGGNENQHEHFVRRVKLGGERKPAHALRSQGETRGGNESQHTHFVRRVKLGGGTKASTTTSFAGWNYRGGNESQHTHFVRRVKLGGGTKASTTTSFAGWN